MAQLESKLAATLKGHVALVTGASRGLGKGIAKMIAEAGATVYITGMKLNKFCLYHYFNNILSIINAKAFFSRFVITSKIMVQA